MPGGKFPKECLYLSLSLIKLRSEDILQTGREQIEMVLGVHIKDIGGVRV